jgi:hypothetical protein
MVFYVSVFLHHSHVRFLHLLPICVSHRIDIKGTELFLTPCKGKRVGNDAVTHSDRSLIVTTEHNNIPYVSREYYSLPTS